MTDIIKSLLLGIIEGLTEFLPVSSTAHLLISSHLINFTTIQNNLFEIVIQLGAILAICVIYKGRISSTLLNLKSPTSQKFSFNITIAFLPAAILGLLFHDHIKKLFFSNFSIAIALIIGGIIMLIFDKKDQSAKINKVDNITLKQALLIGIFQSIAMIPGTSRSGATIIGGLIAGLSRKTATEFSFFLAIPTIAAASFYDLLKNINTLTFDNITLIIVGLLSSFFSALVVIKWFINFVSKNSFLPFAIYRIIIGIIILLTIA
ncbi:MAG: undecaprenyl-diphosphate phosphatase [Rickettsiales bacterium]|nr:undecaprenyl-diphosphate phosphatase [Rickettsiales bacterium]